MSYVSLELELELVLELLFCLELGPLNLDASVEYNFQEKRDITAAPQRSSYFWIAIKAARFSIF